ncbi:MAG: hypothetical protein Q9M21_05230 [Mariprofundaceae bacterium]|nr:hypothetical protein [Mariprofundaceae bacterium]
MKNLKYGIKGLAVLLALGINTAAHADDLAIAAKVGTLGLGIEATTNIVPLFANLRLQGNGFNYNTTITDTNVTYDAKLKLATVGLLADIYPFAGKFRITGGAYYNGNKLTMNARPLGAVVIGGTTYTNPTVSTTVDFNKFAPYVGIGWGDAISSGSPIGFSIELGAMYMGKPKTSIVAPGVTAADIAAEKSRLDSSLKNMQFYPVASVGVNFKF